MKFLKIARIPILLFALCYEVLLVQMKYVDLYKYNILLFVVLVFLGVRAFRFGRFKYSNAYFIVLLTIPFYILTDTLFYGTIIDQDRLLTTPLLNNIPVIFYVSCWANISLIGFLLGIALSSNNIRGVVQLNQPALKTNVLSLNAFVLFIILLTGLYYYISPKGDILTGYYSDIRDTKNDGGFSGLSYVLQNLLLILYIDFKQMRISKNRKVKMIIWSVSFAYIVLFLHLLKGERTIAGMCFSVFLLHLLYRSDTTDLPQFQNRLLNSVRNFKPLRFKTKKRRNGMLILLLVAFLGSFYFLGFIRNENSTEVSGSSPLTLLLNSYKMGTWKGGFYAALGMADEYTNTDFEYLNGQTYLDYILSLPPSFVASALDYERPISSTTGPGYWYLGYTIGGLSPIIVPFKNFGFTGILVIMMLWGAGIVYMEQKLLNKPGGDVAFKRYLYAAFMLAMPHLFWYGEMYLVRSIMSALIVYYLYQKLPKRA